MTARRAYAHEAAVVLAADGDVRALGGAVTVALCGHWEHEPPCPLAPHRTDTQRTGDQVSVRVVFAAEPEAEPEVRTRIDRALAEGGLTGPDGATTGWRLVVTGPSTVREDETELADRLLRS